MGYLPNVFMGKAEAPRHIGDDTPNLFRVIEFNAYRCRIHGGYQLSRGALYAESRMDVNRKTHIHVNVPDKRAFGRSFRVARLETGMTQTELGQIFEVSQDIVSRWENGATAVPVIAVRELANRVCPDSRRALLRAAGLPEFPEDALRVKSETRKIPLLSDSNELGAPNERMERYLSLPSEWLPDDANVKATRFASDISPLFGEELIALVDTRYKDPDRLLGCIVAVRTPSGPQPMILKKDGGTYFFISLRDDDRSVRLLQSDGDWSIVGKVLKWIGDAPVGRG